jgi:hypothetical protein
MRAAVAFLLTACLMLVLIGGCQQPDCPDGPQNAEPLPSGCLEF